ncbi:MAG: MATE family efflux transporter [Lachnospiraceae bacterium]|nr:MATE family efflux transporter [Lachnospiraceae bacterium]
METKRKTLTQLFFPICIEILFFMMAGMVDTMMLSTVSDQAVGAVGTANTYIGIFIIMFSIVSSGMLAVMTQNIGAGRPGVAHRARQIGLLFNGGLGVVLSAILLFGAELILEGVGIAEALKGSAVVYLKIVGGSCILNAVIPIYSGYMRAFGYTREPLVATVAANVINLVLNAVFLLVLEWGVAGVALATVISRVLNLIMVMSQSRKLIHVDEDTDEIKNGEVLRQIIRIGFPAALETALYNVAITLVVRFMNQMDTEGINVTARSYTAQIANFSYSVGAALAQANAILTGWRIGAKEFDECDRGTKKAALVGIGSAIVLQSLFAVFARPIVGLFTDDPRMIMLVSTLLAVDIVLEIGRAVNMVFGIALKASGDAVYPVVIAAIFMFVCAVGGTWFFGLRLELLAVGAYIGLALDECVRAVFMFGRWQSGKWREKRLVH